MTRPYSVSVLLALLAVSGPAAAQPATQAEVMFGLWVDVVGGAEAAAAAVDEIDEPSSEGDDPEAVRRRRIVVATGAAAAAAAQLSVTTQLAIALAPEGEQARVEAELGPVSVALYESLLTVVVDARDWIQATDDDQRASRKKSSASIRSLLVLLTTESARD